MARSERFDEAISLQEEVLAKAYKEHGENDVGPVLIIRSRLATIHKMAGNISEFVRLAKQNWLIQKWALGADSLDTLMAQIRLADAYHTAGELDAAKELLELTESTCARTFPDSHLLVNARQALAWNYATRGHADEAITRYKNIIESWSPSTGEVGGKSYLIVVRGLVLVLKSAHRHDEALAVVVEALERSSPEGRMQATALALRSQLAELYNLTGRRDQAFTTATNVTRDAEIMYGAEHSITQSYREKLTTLTTP